MQLLQHAHAINAQFDLYENRGRAAFAANGALKEDIGQQEIGDAIASHRRDLALLLQNEASPGLVEIDAVFSASDRMRGTLYGRALEQDEQAILQQCEKLFTQNWGRAGCFAAFVTLSLYRQPFELPLQKNIGGLGVRELERYLVFTMRQPHLMSEGDEDAYITYYKDLTAWLLHLISDSDAWDTERRAILLQAIKQKLTFGACYYLDRPIIDIVKQRARIIEAVVRRDPESASVKGFPANAPAAAGRTKIRLGIFSRNVADYTDTRALYALFHAFDPARYDIYWYSLDIIDPSSLDDAAFTKNMRALCHKIVSLRGSASAMANMILSDDLDIFAVGTGYSFSVKDIDQMLFHRLGRVQLALSELISGSSALPSYDYFFVPEAAPDVMEIYRRESTEQLKIMQGSVLWYEKRPKTQTAPHITRAALGIPDNAVLYCSGAAANKQMAGTLNAYMEILCRVPDSYLLFYPFNPAWGGYFIGLTFLARLRAVMAQFPDIGPARIIVVRQVSPQDGNRLIQLCDIYLGSFPRGGATSAMLALRHGKPVVARREKWLHSHDDAVMLRSLSCDALIGNDTKDYIDIAVRLGTDAAMRQKWTEHIVQNVETAPFFDIQHNSRKFQIMFNKICGERGLSRLSTHPSLSDRNEA